MTLEEYRAFPKELRVREVKTDHQVLVTTLLDHRKITKTDLSQLYKRRWSVELDLRNLKTTMGTQTLHCQTPEMNEKELWVHLLAYNLIRLLMAQAANNAGVDPRSLSFKHTSQLWTEWNSRGMTASTDLFILIAQSEVGQRPDHVDLGAADRMNIGPDLPIEVVDFEVIEIRQMKSTDTQPRQREQVSAADAAESGDGHALGAQRVLLGFRNPADIAVERLKIGIHFCTRKTHAVGGAASIRGMARILHCLTRHLHGRVRR